MDQLSSPERRGYRRVAVVGILVLLALGLFPSTAAVLDEANEDLILPLFLLVMVVAGMLLWSLVPGLTDGTRSRAHLVGIGAVLGLVAAAVAIAVFFALLNGYSGA
jgi:hypothetical protein